MTKQSRRSRLILMDDDPIYRTIMLHCAAMHDLDCDAFESFAVLGSVGIFTSYDAALVDYDLGEDCGLAIAEALAHATEVPMILLSTRPREPQGKAWPSSIKMFINKSKGYEFALTQARSIAERHRS